MAVFNEQMEIAWEAFAYNSPATELVLSKAARVKKVFDGIDEFVQKRKSSIDFSAKAALILFIIGMTFYKKISLKH